MEHITQVDVQYTPNTAMSARLWKLRCNTCSGLFTSKTYWKQHLLHGGKNVRCKLAKDQGQAGFTVVNSALASAVADNVSGPPAKKQRTFDSDDRTAHESVSGPTLPGKFGVHAPIAPNNDTDSTGSSPSSHDSIEQNVDEPEPEARDEPTFPLDSPSDSCDEEEDSDSDDELPRQCAPG